MSEKIKLFANCIPVKGANRSAICDLQRNRIKLIPNDLFDFLDNFESQTIQSIKKTYNHKFDEVIDEYINFMISKEFLFLTKKPEQFPKLSLIWDEPFTITNAIIDLDKYSNYEFMSFISQLENVNCKHLEIRYFDTPAKNLVQILQEISKSNSVIHSIDVIASGIYEKKEYCINLICEYPRLQSIVLYGSDEDIIVYPLDSSRRRVVFSKQSISAAHHCGVVSSINFAVNVKNFTESLKHNSCLNRKISIDVNGNIKNCPSMLQNFGNIKDTTLQEALTNKGFKKYWNITKDQIDVCKDCEFRYVCTDCRAYIEKTEDQYSKPLKCGYSPYTNKWEDWSTNPLKQKAIEYYGMQELVKKNV